jgi:thioredoxin reductase
LTIQNLQENAASHGVHNFLGLDGLLPTDIRKIAWEQIDKYDSAEFRKGKIVNVNKEENGTLLITSVNGTSIKAKKVVLAVGYHDVYPDIPVLSNVGQIRLFPVLFAMVTKIETVSGVLW